MIDEEVVYAISRALREVRSATERRHKQQQLASRAERFTEKILRRARSRGYGVEATLALLIATTPENL